LRELTASYFFSCPQCAGRFSIEVDKIPPVASRLRCQSCGHPMDFPSRDQARASASMTASAATPEFVSNLQDEPPAFVSNAQDSPPELVSNAEDVAPPPRRAAEPAAAAEGAESAPVEEGPRFRILKVGFEKDVYDRRALRNLIRAGEVHDADRIRVDDAEPVRAGSLTYLGSLFSLRKTAKTKPLQCCRTHTDKVAFFQCQDTGRPLCEDCAEQKKFGGTTIRVCKHCGGTCKELPQA